MNTSSINFQKTSLDPLDLRKVQGKKLLVIGAGKNQVPIISCAKNMGCTVYVVTPKGGYPGIDIADYWPMPLN